MMTVTSTTVVLLMLSTACHLVTAGVWTGWSDNHDYMLESLPGRWIMRRSIRPVPCGSGTPKYIQVQQQVGSSWQDVLQAGDMITVGPRYGLACSNAQNPLDPGWPKCSDYFVKYHTLRGEPLCMTASPWMDRDNPIGNCDCEQASYESTVNKQWAAESLYIEYKAASPNVVRTFGRRLDRKIHVGADFGLLCSDDENQALGLGRCRPYRVRFYCPSKQN